MTEMEKWFRIYQRLCPGGRNLPYPFSLFARPGRASYRHLEKDKHRFCAPSSSSSPSLTSCSTQASTSSSVSSFPLSGTAHTPITVSLSEFISVGEDCTSQQHRAPRFHKTVIIAAEIADSLLLGVRSQFWESSVDLYDATPVQQKQHLQLASLVDTIDNFLSAHEASKGFRQYTGRAAGSHDSAGYGELESTGSGKRSRAEESSNGTHRGNSDSDRSQSGNTPSTPESYVAPKARRARTKVGLSSVHYAFPYPLEAIV
jgi:hypothetical protein